MFINLCFINVVASIGNRSVVCDVFSYVDVIFIVDPAVDDNGVCVDGDVGDFVFVSGVDGCDAHAYIRWSLLGLFDVVCSNRYGLILRTYCSRKEFCVGGIYLRPGMLSVDVDRALRVFLDCHVLAGDMNARGDRWRHVADVGGHNHQGTTVARVLADFDFMVPSIPTHDGTTVIDLCAFRQ